jgi:cytochrome c553
MKLSNTLILIISLLSVSSVLNAADIKAGKTKAILCAACHGTDGIATQPIYPNLAGQNEPYLASSLKAYRDKQRSGGLASIMQMQAAKLTDEDIGNLAAYFASLK